MDENGSTMRDKYVITSVVNQSQGETDTVAFYKCMMGDLDFHVCLDGQAYNAEDLSTARGDSL